MRNTIRCVVSAIALGCCFSSSSHAALITGAANENINTNTTNNPFFSNNGSSPYKGSVLTNTSGTSTVMATGRTVTGSASQGSGFTDGNGIPDGVIVSFDVQFVINANMGNLSHSTDGDGMGINTGAVSANQLNGAEQLFFSSISLSNAMVAADPNGYLLNNSATVGNGLWRVLRSNNFSEPMNEGARTSSDAAGTMDVTVFGASPNIAIQNDFDTGLLGDPLPSVYISTTAGVWQVKGIGFRYDVTVNAIPEPAAMTLVCLGLTIFAGWRRTRFSSASR